MTWRDEALRMVVQARDILAADGHPREALDLLNSALAVSKFGEDKVDPCPNCGEPWWTVQVRCKCYPKPGTLEEDIERLEAAVCRLAEVPRNRIKVVMSRLDKAKPLIERRSLSEPVDCDLPPVIGRDTDGTPLYKHRIPIEDRPHVGENWHISPFDWTVTIIKVDPYGRSFEYIRERERWSPDGTKGTVQVTGDIGGLDVSSGGAKKVRDADPPWEKEDA